MARESKEPRILNVGCGNDTYGTDFVDLYPVRDDVIRCDVEKEKLPFRDNTFDEVFSGNIFEHLKNPNLVLREMSRVLKPGGRVVLKTDNAGFWLFHNSRSKWKVHYGGYERLGAHGKEDKHYSLFTPHHVKNHFDAVGIRLEKAEYYSDFGGLSIPIRLISWLLSKTRFHYMAMPKMTITGRKIRPS